MVNKALKQLSQDEDSW